MTDSGLASLTGCKFEFLVSCMGLADLDEFTKSDPMCVFFFKHFGQWKEIFRTEAIRNTLNPKFVDSFVLVFDPTLQQSLKLSVYDIDSRSLDLRHHDLVGNVEVSFEELVSPEKLVTTCCKTLRVPGSSRGRGIISITTERVNECKDKISLHIGANKLNKRGRIIATKPDVYLEISRSIDNVSFHPVYRTETLPRTQNPRWRPMELDMQRLCNGDWDRQLEISVWHHSGTGDYKMIGRKVTTLRELNMMKIEGHYKDISLAPRKKENENKLKNHIKITSCGHLRFFSVKVDCDYSLLDFTRGGMQFNLLIAVDFTASNGKPGEDASLHTISNGKNPYIEVIDSLGGLVGEYCSEQNIGMIGFGAKTHKSSATSHCFPLSQKWDSLYVNDIQSAIDVYKRAVGRVKFSGPTKLKPVIAHAESLTVREPTQIRQTYTVLLVITDGIVNDIDDVMERLVSISHLPLSVVFVGVGPADFALMESFSHHSMDMLSVKELGVTASRRHTHFVAFPRDSNSTEALARETFGVISAQATYYMRHRGIVPNKPDPSTPRPTPIPTQVKTEDIGMRRSASRTSLSSVLSRRCTASQGPKCPTCGSALDLDSAVMTTRSLSEMTLTGIG